MGLSKTRTKVEVMKAAIHGYASHAWCQPHDLVQPQPRRNGIRPWLFVCFVCDM